MASNPMQRQKKVSFLLGFLTMLVLASVVIGFLGYMLIQTKSKQKEIEDAMREVYVVMADIESGGKIDSSVITTKKVAGELVPENKLTAEDLVDDEGNIREDLISKIELKSGTVLTTDMITVSSEKISDDLRKVEYNFVSLPTEIKTGEYIDVRVRFSSGVDYIVLSKKQITIPEIAGVPSADTFSLNLKEDEIILMSSAMVEVYATKGSEIYIGIYTDPGSQGALTPTYQPSDAVMRLIGNNPNIVTEAKNELFNRYNKEERERIQNEVDSSENTSQEIESGIQEHITRQKQYRQEYIDALTGE